MNETDRIRTLLAELADGEPPVDIDVDREITRGRRRARRRAAATLSTAAVIASAVVTAAVIVPHDNGDLVDPTQTTPPPLPGKPIQGTPRLPPVQAKRTSDYPADRTTTKSRALLRELQQLAPELRSYPSLKPRNGPWTDGKKLTRHLTAIMTEPTSATQLAVGVEMGARNQGIGVPSCMLEDQYNCGQARRLPDGSIALLDERPGHLSYWYRVNLIRPDGIEIHVWSLAQRPTADSKEMPLLSVGRLLDIARGITVVP